MKIGMNLLLWTTKVSEAEYPIIDQLAEIGFDTIEVPVFDTSDLTPYEQLGKKLRSLGLSSTAVTVCTPDANPISPDSAIRDAAHAHLSRVLECCQAFDCQVLCGPIHSALGCFSGCAPTEDEFKAGVETLQRVADVAQSRKIRLGIEYLNRFENYFLTTAAGTARFVKAVNHPSCKMMYDSFHAHIEEKSQTSAIASCVEHVVHAHVSENDRGTPGTGQVDWKGYFSGLKAGGFNGCYMIEAFGRALPDLAAATKVWRDLFDDPMNLCRQGYSFIKSNVG